ncbi:MAG: O-antigen ligase family protein [bacterium]|nr:O-antigen ligase family protein [bacterium]
MINLSAALVIFFSSFNLFFILDRSDSLIGSWTVDYLLLKVYLGQLFLLLFLLLCLWQQKNQFFPWLKKNFLAISSLIFLLVVWCARLRAPLVAWQQLLTVGSLVWFAVIVRKKWQNRAPKLIINTVWALVIVQSLLAIYQFCAQMPLFPYQVLGETNLHAASDIAHVVWAGRSLIAPYGTFAHPNILAGTLVILLWWLWRQGRFSALWQKIATCLALFVILLTQSWSAGLFLILLILSGLQSQKGTKVHYKWWALTLLVVLCPIVIQLGSRLWPQNLSFTRRAQLNQVAEQMFFTQPWLGVGPAQFTANVGDFWPGNQFTQPVHNVFLLFLAETGLIGCLCLFLFLRFTVQKSPRYWRRLFPSPLVLAAWLIFLSLDHYLLTSFWGLLLLLVFL